MHRWSCMPMPVFSGIRNWIAPLRIVRWNQIVQTENSASVWTIPMGICCLPRDQCMAGRGMPPATSDTLTPSGALMVYGLARGLKPLGMRGVGISGPVRAHVEVALDGLIHRRTGVADGQRDALDRLLQEQGFLLGRDPLLHRAVHAAAGLIPNHEHAAALDGGVRPYRAGREWHEPLATHSAHVDR